MTVHTDVLAFLDSIQSGYPYGVPSSLISPKTDIAHEPQIVRTAPLEVIFVAENKDATKEDPWKGPAGELLLMAVDKGMKKAKNVVGFLPLPLHSPIEVLKKINDKNAPARVVVCMGEEVARLVLGGEVVTKGIWTTTVGGNLPVLPTVSPQEVTSTPAAKREFWEDLKKVLVKLQG